MRIIITGSHGLIGSEAAEFYLANNHTVLGIDNNLRKYFFGSLGDTLPVQDFLLANYRHYQHSNSDIRSRQEIHKIFQDFQPEFIIHTAGQPSHDWAAREPFTDFDVNAVGTLNLLEAFRLVSPQAVFVFMSTNKVYGNSPNEHPLVERPTRYEYRDLETIGINENQSIDQSLHSLFGVSKLSADVMCQEYGKYFNLKVGIFRGGCLTGSKHRGVALHGFLSYLIDCALKKTPYTIIGHKGKQVRDQIHSLDVIQALDHFRLESRCGEVYNLGGGFLNSASIIEILDRLKVRFGVSVKTSYTEQSRRGDHICYYTDLKKMKTHFPKFKIQMDLDHILDEMVNAADLRLRNAA